MRRRYVTTLLLFLLACSAAPSALTREQAAALQQALSVARPHVLARHRDASDRRRLEEQLDALDRALMEGTADQLLQAIAAARVSAGSTPDTSFAFVLAQAEAAASHNSIRRQP